MAELISKQALIEKIYQLSWNQGIIDAINKFPVTETSEIEAEWIPCTFMGVSYNCCPNCKNQSKRPTNYCPTCGARLREKEDLG